MITAGTITARKTTKGTTSRKADEYDAHDYDDF